MSNGLKKTRNNAGSAGLKAELFTGIIGKMTGIYVMLMCVVFPLYVTDMYYNVLGDKFDFFVYSTMILAGMSLMVLFVGALGGAFRKDKEGKSPLAALWKLSPADICLLVFFGVCTVSTFCSEWIHEAFWGDMGRLQGLYFFFFVLVSWFFVTRFFRFRPLYLYAFLAAGVLVLAWGVTDYLGLDILGWRADADSFWAMLTFTSSIGNVNTYTAIAALYFGVSASLVLDRKTLWFSLPVFWLSALGMITGASDNALLAAAGIFALLPFYVFRDARRAGMYLILAAFFLLAMAATGWLTSVWTRTPVLYEANWGILTQLSNKYLKSFIAPAFGLLAAGVLIWYLLRKKEQLPTKMLQILWGVLCILAVFGAAYCFYDANTAGRLTFLEPYRKYLLFDDRWGTNRGYAWRSSFEFFRDFSPFKKLVGSGPETYSVFMAENYYYEMMDFMGSIFDSPHSEPIQYLFTVGILGFLAFYSMIVTGVVRGLKSGIYPAAFAFATAAYIFASIINISVPISTPLLFLCLELAVSIPKETNEKNN